MATVNDPISDAVVESKGSTYQRGYSRLAVTPVYLAEDHWS